MESLSEYMAWGHLTTLILAGIGVISAFFACGNRGSFNGRNTWVPVLLLVLFLIYRLGLHPIGYGLGSDRSNYAYYFISIDMSGINSNREQGYAWLNYILGKIVDVNGFFIAISLIYITCYCNAIKNICGNLNYWQFVSVVISMSFCAYNTNTMRAGLALSFLILGFSHYPKKIWIIIFGVIAISIHNSAALPFSMACVSYFFPNKTRLFYYLWFLAIPISFAAGGFFTSYFSNLIVDERMTHYLSKGLGFRYKTGFRIDFIIYSLIPMIVGAYYIFKKKYSNNFYKFLYNTYILTNIFWILLIRANYSDRFAYLSWCLIPFILVYPLVSRSKVKVKANLWLAAILLGESIFLLIV